MNWELFLRPQVLVFVFGCGIPIVAIIAHYWYKAAKCRSENELKRTMVERGMSADDIERVVRASSPDDDAAADSAGSRAAG